MILYGEGSSGKTSTLMYLAALLAGSGSYIPTIWTSITRHFFIGGKHIKDARFIVDYKGKRIFIATGGDSWAICTGNYNFFSDEFRNVTIYKIDSTGVRKLTALDKRKDAFHDPDLCIGACRPIGDRKGAIKAIHSYSEDVYLNTINRYKDTKNYLNYDLQIWVKRNEKNFVIQAFELLGAIDSYCSLGSYIILPA